MKMTENNDKKHKIKKKTISKTKNKKDKVLIVAQEIKFARLLSDNEKKARDRVLKAVRKWVSSCFVKGYNFKEEDFTRLWKGLFYAVWMSDKPLVQEELCENIGSILDLFPEERLSSALLLMRAGFRHIASEWYGIDHHRMDKFLMLVRRWLRYALRCIRRSQWSAAACNAFADALSQKGILSVQTVTFARNATSMILHVLDCYLEEIAKVSEGEIEEESVCALLRPVCALVAGGEPMVGGAARRVLTSLVRQSDLGLEYRSRTHAWHKMGCPGKSPDDLQLVSDDSGDSGEEENGDERSTFKASEVVALDPRAGRVNVTLPTLPVPSTQLAAMLREALATAKGSAHRRTKICLQRFEKLSQNEYPLRIASKPDAPTTPPLKSKRRGKGRRRPPTSYLENGKWQVEDAKEEGRDKNHRSTANKENKKRKREGQSESDVLGKKQKTDKAQDKLEKSVKNNQMREKLGHNIKEHIKVMEKGKSLKDKKEKVKMVESKIIGKMEKSMLNAMKSKLEKNDKNKVLKQITQTKVPTFLSSKIKNQKHPKPAVKTEPKDKKSNVDETKIFAVTPKKVKFVLKNNSMQKPVDYYKSIRQSPNIPFDSDKKPSKTNLKPCTPSPINPFFRRKSAKVKITPLLL